MATDRAEIALVFQCDLSGVVQDVLHNSAGIDIANMLGRPFPLLVAGTSFQKALSFLVELKAQRTIIDWELELPVDGQTIVAHCVGLALDDHLIILAARTRPVQPWYLDALAGINNEQADHLRLAIKEQIAARRALPEYDQRLYNELTAVNNELVTLQRELAQKNAALERLNAEVQRLATVDDLTHIYNRRGFFELSQREVARAKRFRQPLAAIMFDLDGFKQINDTYGHAVGDHVLTEIAARCSRQLRNVDIFGRYGGDEFSILLPLTRLPGARATAERLRQQVVRPAISSEHGPLTVAMSLGIVALTSDMPNLEALLEQADQALYRAKRSGGNCVRADEN